MYLPGQIVYDLDNKVPIQVGSDVWDTQQPAYQVRTTHFIAAADSGRKPYEIALPRTLLEAQDLLDKNLITPAPINPTHCWECRNWKSNCSRSECSEQAASKIYTDAEKVTYEASKKANETPEILLNENRRLKGIVSRVANILQEKI